MKNKNSGFTLLELMVVVTISGILLMVGIPSFRSMLVTNELASITNDLTMSLKLARSSAITSGKNAYVCSSDDGLKCKGLAGSWSDGWLVWIDVNGKNGYEDGTDELLWVKEADSGSPITIKPTAASTDFETQVKFKYTGTLYNALPGVFELCSGFGATKGYPKRVITITVSGEPQFSKDLATKC